MKKILLSILLVASATMAMAQNVGIDDANPPYKLSVNGTFGSSSNAFISGTLNLNSGVNSYAFPTIRGTANQFLQTDGAGNLSWAFTSATAWGLTGNSGTVATTNFIGTTDNVDFVAKTNNTERLRITSGGNVGIGTTTPASAFSVGTNSEFQVNGTGNVVKINNITTSFPAAQGAANTVLSNDGAGNLSWAFTSATAWGITGNGGTTAGTNFIGTTNDIALVFKVNNQISGKIDNSTGSNTFFGYQAGMANTGTGNTFIGHQTGKATTSGTNNYFSGYQAGFSNVTGSNNVFIGNQAGYNETASSKLYIANSNTATPLIYGDFVGGHLAVNGAGATGASDPKAALDIRSTSQGVMFPRMTQVQRNAITTPPSGLMIYQTDNVEGIRIYNATLSKWLLQTPLSATIQDQKTSGTGGNASSGTQTRALNTLDDPHGIVTSLLSNQFTLAPGRYYVEGSAPAFHVDVHRATLFNVTAAATSITGSTHFTGASGNYSSNVSEIKGFVTITVATTFEVRHQCQTAKVTNGLGLAISSGLEIYTHLKITKLE